MHCKSPSGDQIGNPCQPYLLSTGYTLDVHDVMYSQQGGLLLTLCSRSGNRGSEKLTAYI